MNNPQVVIITGAARGIGFGIATCFARQGAKIVVADVDGTSADRAAEELKKLGAGGAIGAACDVSDRAAISATLDKTIQAFGGVDVLVNNAGICPFVDGMKMTPEVWRRTLDVNLTGAWNCTQIIGKRMIEQKTGGRVVCITSLSENLSNGAQVDYAASKSGLRMMTVSFATSLGRKGITCNCVAPGHIITDMTRHHWETPGPAEEIKKRVPVGRIGTPEDIGHVVVFLASPQAEYINGITIRVDGGFQACCV